MKKVCIVGGMGPLATADYYKKLVLKTPAGCDQEHIETLIISDSRIPDRTAAIKSGEYDELLARFENNFKLAEIWGADLIAIPCNTAHYFMDYYLKMTDIEILDMVRETAKKAGKRACVLGTTGTIDSGIYDRRLEELGKESVKLTEEERNTVMDTIYRIKEGASPEFKNFPKYEALIREKLGTGATVLISCTELSLLKFDDENVIDAVDVAIEKIIEKAF